MRKSILHRLDPRLSGIGSQVSGRSKLESSFVKPSWPSCLLVSTLPPSPPRYWNHGVREEKSTRSLILKDLHLKSLRTNDLRCQRALNMGLGSFEGRLGRRARLCRPNQRAIVALGGLEVCDGGHWVVVMKERALESGVAHAHTFAKDANLWSTRLIVMKKESKVPPKRSLDGPPADP